MGVVRRRRDLDWWGGILDHQIGLTVGWIWPAGKEPDGVVKCEADCSIIDMIKYDVRSESVR